jgi:hypothetical protein
VVRQSAAVGLAVLHAAVQSGQVLVQRAALGDVDHLDAAADAEDRLAGGAGGAVEGDLERVALRVDDAQVGLGRLPEARRIDVGAAREQQGVGAGDRLFGRVGSTTAADMGRPPSAWIAWA